MFIQGMSVAFSLTAILITIASMVKEKPVTKTCYVTEWKTVKKNGQQWKEPVKQICVKGESNE